MAMRVWAIDVGSAEVKLCSLQSGFRSYVIDSVERVPVARPSEGTTVAQAQRAALGKLLATPRLRADSVVVALPGTVVASHLLTLPFTDTKRLEQTLAFEVEGLIPFDLTEVVYDYQAVGQEDGKTFLLVAVARRTAIRELLEMLGEHGIDPRSVLLAPSSLQPLLPKGDGLEAILDVGLDRSCLALFHDGALAFARAFDVGGDTLTRAIEADLQVPWETAEALKVERGSLLDDGDATLVPPLARALQSALREIRQTLKLVASRRHRGVLSRLWLTGGGSRLRGLDALLARELGCEVRALPAPELEGQAPPPGWGDPELSLAVGLALSTHAGSRAAGINLRRGDQSFQGDFAKLRGKLGKLAALAGLLAVMTGVRAYAQVYVLGQREARIDDAVCKSTQKAIGRCLRDINVAKSALLGGSSGGSTIPRLSALDLLSETASRLGMEGTKITELDVGTDQVRLRGEAGGFDLVDKVVSSLHAYRCFQDIQRGRVQRIQNGSKVEFNLEVRNACLGTPGGDR